MTLLEVVFALFMFAGSGAASMFAISSTIAELETVETVDVVHDAADEVCAMWLAKESIPPSISVDGKTCKIAEEIPGDQEAVHFEIRLGNDSQNLWLSPVS
jgi:hypothetical protein